MNSASRNDPCPCGSGKKFKKCHGAPDFVAEFQPPLASQADHVKALDRELVDRLLRFARKRAGADWLRNVVVEFNDGSDEGFDNSETQLAIPWGIYDRPIPGTHTSVASAFRDEQGRRLPAEMLALLDANLRAWLSVWEVQNVSPGVGLALRDLLTGEERFIHEVSGSQSAAVRDALLAKVVDFGDVSFSAATHPQPLGPSDADAVLREFRDFRRKTRQRVTTAMLRDPDHQIDLIDLWREQVELIRARPMPALTNTDGDPFALTTDHFDLSAGRMRQVIDKLRAFPGAQESEDGGRGEKVIVVTKPGDRVQKTWQNIVIGRIVLSAKRMSVESNSTRRADKLRADLEAHLGALVSHRLREETSQPALMEQARAAADKPVARRSQPPELAAIAREYREQAMVAWLDEPVPALKGLTPRQAAAKPKTRAALDLLLRDFEHMEARLPPAERIDIASLRAELGVTG